MEQTEEKEVVEDNGVYLVIENDSPESKDQIKRKSVKILSILHIGSGLLSFSMETVKMGIRSLYQRNEGPDFTTGEGFYCGSIYLLAGLLGLLSLTRTNYCKISAFMILSIFSALFGFVMIVSSLIGSFQTMHQEHNLGVFAHSVLIICGLFELVVGIVSAGFSCHACCGCCGGAGQSATGNGGSSVLYIAGGAGAGAGNQPRVVHVNLSQGAVRAADTEQEIEQENHNKNGKYERFK